MCDYCHSFVGRKVTGEKVTVDEGVTMGQEMIEADATGGKTKGRKELR